MELPPFKPWPKISRLALGCVITEKIDGTNGIIHVSETGVVTAGSRNRWLTDGLNNYGFQTWVKEHEDELRQLGPGYHYGEWWGKGIQQGYGMSEKKFSLFNVARWGDNRPSCCDVVPIVIQGPYSPGTVNNALLLLREGGSMAAPGCKYTEGIVVFFPTLGTMCKVTHDNRHKGNADI